MFKVLLAGGDEIVNVPLVLAHLKEFRGAHDKELDQREGTTNMIADVVVKPDLDHAEVVVSSDGVYSMLCNILLVAIERQLLSQRVIRLITCARRDGHCSRDASGFNARATPG